MLLSTDINVQYYEKLKHITKQILNFAIPTVQTKKNVTTKKVPMQSDLRSHVIDIS